MPFVDIGSHEFFSYASTDEADEYFAAAIHASAWREADDDDKAMSLVTATRVFDRQSWQGEKLDGAQANAWPRTDIDSIDDEEPINSDEVPIRLVHATMELALALLQDAETLQTTQSNAQKIASLSAGSVSISYFRGAEGSPLRFPLAVMELIGEWLGASGGDGSIGFSSGTDGVSAFGTPYGRTRGL